ncbi:peptidoglycan-binding protein [Cerasicoccus arenae]|uniref:Peptidoglycan binding-like domain-containing protein n=1 Tax=Cerasicoccus arenae TaxID=424488 RepID=A0A8J3D9H6_9BACT|nr:peptidoglycan-binding protein [Cerasicoccus arenae]MBK1857676.1 peptidoglycan-binding protein [Cerasicoccus arenae]GHB91443.1 hypothetical protein GCM10007047_03160 [Cerasicoccus arenae]
MNKTIIITCAAGIVGVTTLSGSQTMEAEEGNFFDDVASFFTGDNSDNKALNESGPGDHEESRSPHKQYPKLALEKQVPAEKRYQITAQSEQLPFPKDAITGDCYAEVIVPAKFDIVSEKVLQQEGSSRIEVTPAQYEWVEQTVMTKPAETRLEIVPAQYKTVTEKVMVEPAREETISIPATFKTVSEQVLVRPATKVWMDGEVEVERPADLTGDIVCLIEKPAEYQTVTRQVIDQPARTEVQKIPAQYKTIQKQVLVSEATTREITIPAQYDTIQVRQEMTPARTEEINIEPQYAMVSREVLVESAHTRWEKVLCEDSISPELAWEVEDRLKAEGFDPGPIDGEIDEATQQAVEDYQMANNLPMGGLTPTTLENLGIVNFKQKTSAPKVASIQ